ncbi:MAG: 50S ribosomal protein L11 methyltransferase [Chloroflexota bacterium]
MSNQTNANQQPDELIEIAVVVDSEAAEAVSELFNRYNGGGYDEDNEAGEAGGGGAVIEATGFDDFANPIEGEYQLTVKTYIKPGERGAETRRLIEEGLWRLSLLYPVPEPTFTTIRQEDWANAWKEFYKPLRVGNRVVLKPSWEEFDAQPDDIIIELDPGMAFGTGLHPSTRLCIQALETYLQPGDALLDIGTGSGVLSIVGVKLGASQIWATDIDPLAVQVTQENAEINQIAVGDDTNFVVRQDSVPASKAGVYPVVVANILAEVLTKLFDSEYDNVPLAEPLSEGGHMILAGILEEKAQMVIDAAARYGLTLVDTLQESDWVALVVKR